MERSSKHLAHQQLIPAINYLEQIALHLDVGSKWGVCVCDL